MPKINMLRRLIILLYLIASASFYLPGVNGQSLLWKISGGDLDSTSYLFGTIHIKDKRVYCLNDSVLTAFEKCDAFAMEVDLNPENLAHLSSKMLLPDDQTLQDLFTEEEYQLITTVIEDITGMDILLFNRLKPIAILSLVMNFQFANDVDVSVDEYLYREAVTKDKKIIGIETIEEQLEILETIPNDYIIDYFKNIEHAEEDMEIIIKLYKSAELEDLLEMMLEDKSMVMIQKTLLTDRNIKMSERIQKLIKEQSVFIAVGAGHLPGREGIINMLTRAGYNVEPVKINNK
ncbi:MAG: TraB/GumN family protein [Bacteroidales bacterium]|nr:MAG: TraB/GumN family protein [Bacteroidales bacterium]